MARLALVTGGARGIGAETCRRLARDGLIVAVADLNLAGAREVARQLDGKGHDAFAVDITDEDSVIALFRTVESRLGPIAVLACVAGGASLTRGVRARIAETSLADWSKTEALNGRGTFLCIREFLRRREASPVTDGRIITLSSTAGLAAGSPTGAAYAAAKAAIIGLTRCAALEAAPLGITANAIAPGMIDTPAVRDQMTPAQIEAAGHSVPLGSIGEPRDVAATIAFLVSTEARYLTGCTISVSGGRYIP